LSKLLLDQIRSNLPSLISEATGATKKRTAERESLGRPLITYREQRNLLSSMARSFQDITDRALSGKYDHVIFGYLGEESSKSQRARLRANIREMNRLFSIHMLGAGRKFTIEATDSTDEEDDVSDDPDSNLNKSDDGSDADNSDYNGVSRRSMGSRGSKRPRSSVLSSTSEDDEPFHRMEELDASFLEYRILSNYYHHREPRKITREEFESLVLEYVPKWRGTEGYGDTNTTLTKEVYKDQASPWERIVNNHSEALWEAVKDFLGLALQQTIPTNFQERVGTRIIRPAMESLRETFFGKREEILDSHRNLDPSCYDGLINNRVLNTQMNRLGGRLSHWAGEETLGRRETDGDLNEGTYTVIPSGMERFAAARSVDLATLCLEVRNIYTPFYASTVLF
jgi:hypothetical protein